MNKADLGTTIYEN